MNTCSITLNFPSPNEALLFLSAYASKYPATLEAIAFADRPDVGVEQATVASLAPAMFNPFSKGAAVAQVPPPPAPSTAAAEAPPTVPAAPTSTAAVPVPVPPAPATASAAPALAAPAAPTNPAGIAVDADGLPWDARIHAGGGKNGEKPKNADGRWRQKRGLNDGALKARVEAELRQAMGAPAASVPAIPTPPAASIPTAPPAATSPAPTAAIPATPVAPLRASSASAPAGESFPAFMSRVGGMLVSGVLTQEALTGALAAVGLQSMGQLAVRPDLVPSLSALLP